MSNILKTYMPYSQITLKQRSLSLQENSGLSRIQQLPTTSCILSSDTLMHQNFHLEKCYTQRVALKGLVLRHSRKIAICLTCYMTAKD